MTAVDTGPAYPPPPAAGSNAIGGFQIGVSSIGDIRAFDWWRTILSQYANSPRIIAVLENFADAIDPTENLTAFFDQIWNIDTAQGYGLDVWGRIVGVERVLRVVEDTYLAFNEANDPSGQSFGFGPFYDGNSGLTQNFSLSDQAYRKLIMAKAAFNITDCAIPSINRLLMHLFSYRGNAFVVDGIESSEYFGFAEQPGAQTFGFAPFYNGQPLTQMTMQYVFNFKPTPVEIAIITSSGVLPKPTGVLATIEIRP